MTLPDATAEFTMPDQLAWEPPPTWEEELLPLPATQWTAGYLPAMGQSGFGDLVNELRHTLLLGYGDVAPLEITPGAALHWWSGPIDLDLPPRVYDLYVDLRWRPIEREHLGLMVGMTPGLYGDFERVDGDTFQLTGWLLANYWLGSRLNLLGGLAYVRQLRSNWLPIGGVVWYPSDDTRMEILIPKPKLGWRIHHDGFRTDWVYLAGQLGGGSWAVADTPTSNVLLGYSDLRLLMGWEGASVAGHEWQLELGYVFARDLSVDGDSVYLPHDTLFLQISYAL